jgi:hypothetical protein
MKVDLTTSTHAGDRARGAAGGLIRFGDLDKLPH